MPVLKPTRNFRRIVLLSFGRIVLIIKPTNDFRFLGYHLIKIKKKRSCEYKNLSTKGREERDICSRKIQIV